jgi:hypothetical protein
MGDVLRLVDVGMFSFDLADDTSDEKRSYCGGLRRC